MDGTGSLERGRRAFDRRAWAEAYDHLSAAAEHAAIGCDDLERLATAAYLAGHDDASTEAWVRAHQTCLDRGDPAGAARCAFWLGFGLLQRGNMAQGGGWLARARRMLEDQGLDCVECGYVLVPDALLALYAGDARAAADELADLAGRAGAAPLEAAAAHAVGAVLVAEGDPAGALDALHDARHAWQELEAPYEAAETRLLIAVACRALDDHDTAALERDAARAAFEQLGAAPALARLDGLFATTARRGTNVTPRELQVLRHVAAGMTNRQIAEALVISEKTVERHLSNIFTKVGVSNRAAATAYAYDQDLV